MNEPLNQDRTMPTTDGQNAAADAEQRVAPVPGEVAPVPGEVGPVPGEVGPVPGERFVSRRPTAEELEHAQFWGNADQRDLIGRVPGRCVLQSLQDQLAWLNELSSDLSTEQVDRIHPPYRWTVRQVFEHCADAERVFGERMMRIAAGDQADLPLWDENAYAASRFGLGNFGHLVSEIAALRQANLLLLRRIVPPAWDNVGSVGGMPISVRAIAWITAGHLQHHFEIVERRCCTGRT